MNSKPLCIASMLVCFITACLTEGNVLTFGRALIVMLIAGALSIWNGAQKEKAFIRPSSDKDRKQKIPKNAPDSAINTNQSKNKNLI